MVFFIKEEILLIEKNEYNKRREQEVHPRWTKKQKKNLKKCSPLIYTQIRHRDTSKGPHRRSP